MDKKLSMLAALLVLSSLAASASAGIVGHWRFDEGTGTVAADSSGQGHNGALEGAPKWTTPGWNNAGWCLQFGGNEDRVSVESFDVAGTGITLAGWVKPSVFNNDARTISKAEGGNTNQHYWALILSGTGENNLQFRLRTDSGAASSYTAADTHDVKADEWTHIAATWDAADRFMRQYKNGKQVQSNAKAGTKVAAGPAVKIGIGNQSATVPDEANLVRPFGGFIDEVLVMDRGLTAGQVADLAQGIVPDFGKATEPKPADGAVGVTSPLLEWAAGENAVFHDVYVGTSAELGAANLVAPRQANPMYWHGPGLEPGVTYYWRVDEIEADGVTLHAGTVWSFTVLPAAAHAPRPADGAGFVSSASLQLTWAAGLNALSHDVYFGDDANAVTAGAADTFKGNQTATTYAPGAVQKGKTYYWRVDEVGAAGKVTGAVWSFTTIGPIAVVDPTLVAWWKLDEGKGATAVDSSGHDHHAALNGSPQWVEGRFGGALDFEFGDTQDCLVAPGFDVVGGGITLSAWIKPESFSQADGRIIDKGTDVAAANDAWWMLSTVASGGQSRLRFRVKTNENATTATQAATSGGIAVGEWCHAAAVWDGASMILYEDGVEVGRMAKGGTAVAVNPEARVYIGNQLGGTQRRPWDGLIDDVRIYDRALSELEVRGLAGN